MYSFQIIDLTDIDVKEYHSFPNKSVLTTKNWIEFVIEDSKAFPLIVRITENSRLVGYFTSLIVKKFGLKIVGSPFSGWSTPYMGFDLLDETEKIKVLPELTSYLMDKTKCSYLQIVDRDLKFEELEQLKSKNIIVEKTETLELGIDGDDAFLFKNMKTDCRNFIRQFERRGATIEQAQPNDEFAEEYYHQLLDVFAKQNLVPTYTAEKVKCLLRHLSKSDAVLCLRVISPDGEKIATSIFPAFNKKMFFWGGASLRQYQHYRPNEYMIYTAIKYWRDRGCTQFDMVGNRSYKKKFGSWEVQYPCITVSRYKILFSLKNMAAWLYYFSGKVLWKLRLKR